LVACRGQPRLQEVHGVNEGARLNFHRKINGIEVGFTVETASQVRAGVDRRLAFAAQRTDEHQLVVSPLVRPIQSGKELRE